MNKIGLDLGNSSIKVVGGEKDSLIYKRIRSLATEISEDTNYVVNLNGEVIHFGVGEPLIEHDKTNRRYLAHSILLSAYETYGPGEHEIALGVTLPINLYKLRGESFKANIEGLGELQGVVNGASISIKIKKVIVQPEGLAAFYALMPEIPKEAILFIDLGHRTTDIVAVNINTDTGKWKIEGSHTLQTGGYELLGDLQNALYPVTNTFFSTQQIEQLLAAGGKVGKVQIDSLYKEALSDRVNTMVKEINQTFNDMMHRQIYICGGASEMFAACYGQDNLQVIKDKKMIYSNAVGSYLKL